jgi:surfeit locus 1 family protein
MARKPRAAASGRRGGSFVGVALALVGVAILLGLGAWQMQRKVWKEHLLARIELLKESPPEPLNVVFHRVRDGGQLDFVRVVARCDGLGEGAAHLYGIRDDGSPGWRQIGACRLSNAPYGAILVDLGFEDTGPADASMPAPGAEPVLLPAEGALITGVLRTPEPKPWYSALLPTNAPAAQAKAGDRFYSRDIPAMAVALHAERPAPVMLSLESPHAGPKLTPAALPTDIPNRHFEYALTWFGLAAVLVLLLLVRLLSGRRRSAH